MQGHGCTWLFLRLPKQTWCLSLLHAECWNDSLRSNKTPRVLCFVGGLDGDVADVDACGGVSPSPREVNQGVLVHLEFCPMHFPPSFRLFQHCFQLPCILLCTLPLNPICYVVYESQAQSSRPVTWYI